ncbi:BgTH12-02396 [Blumeria graminis f. sp. triticale]|uniref:Bgt-675 n=2 Tax=Blumeria graminis TaxID=34373 RepID=A0A9X9MGJ4_BLUGR|nr:hypothetical protein BGT96224_675 [Blumeria graminis f. sp. tritici 96224]CAD6502157.1 BgTH12-02396 [Blumeria graminis f. sp. triticale]VDB86172.1 Bgt-675 [Blumeria graminis f. sp. tritici]
MAADNKMPALKNLQGFLWRSGYESGALRCTLFSDVAPVLQKWNSSGLKIFIYSSGSVAAQKLLFQYTDSGDLRLYINDYYDTVNAGAKNDSQSYASIIAGGPDHLRRAEKWLFCSDRTCEVEAALTVGLEALVVVRPGNILLDAEESSRFHLVQSLADISLDGRANGDSLS